MSDILRDSINDCNWIRTQNHLVRTRTLNQLAKQCVELVWIECGLTLKHARDMTRTYNQDSIRLTSFLFVPNLKSLHKNLQHPTSTYMQPLYSPIFWDSYSISVSFDKTNSMKYTLKVVFLKKNEKVSFKLTTAIAKKRAQKGCFWWSFIF